MAITLASTRPQSPMSEEAVSGKLVWQRHNCVSCHTLFGNGGYEGDDLTQITAKKGSSYLIQYLVHPPVMRPNKYTHHPALNEIDAKNLVEYLHYVQTIPTLGWPPQHGDAEGNS